VGPARADSYGRAPATATRVAAPRCARCGWAETIGGGGARPRWGRRCPIAPAAGPSPTSGARSTRPRHLGPRPPRHERRSETVPTSITNAPSRAGPGRERQALPSGRCADPRSPVRGDGQPERYSRRSSELPHRLTACRIVVPPTAAVRSASNTAALRKDRTSDRQNADQMLRICHSAGLFLKSTRSDNHACIARTSMNKVGTLVSAVL
jgi:hypothetical protein